MTVSQMRNRGSGSTAQIADGRWRGPSARPPGLHIMPPPRLRDRARSRAAGSKTAHTSEYLVHLSPGQSSYVTTAEWIHTHSSARVCVRVQSERRAGAGLPSRRAQRRPWSTLRRLRDNAAWHGRELSASQNASGDAFSLSTQTGELVMNLQIPGK